MVSYGVFVVFFVVFLWCLLVLCFFFSKRTTRLKVFLWLCLKKMRFCFVFLNVFLVVLWCECGNALESSFKHVSKQVFFFTKEANSDTYHMSGGS